MEGVWTGVWTGMRTGVRTVVRTPGGSHKVLLVSVTSGLALLALLAHLFTRRKRTPLTGPSSSAPPSKPAFRHHRVSSPAAHGENGGWWVRGSGSPLRHGSLMSEQRSSVASSLVGASLPPSSPSLTPQQLGTMGMEALETSINYWEDALTSYQAGGPVLPDLEEAEFCRDLQDLLDLAYRAQRKCELLFLDQRSVLFRGENYLVQSDGGVCRPGGPASSLAESFVSAHDQVADLREFDEFAEGPIGALLPGLYQTAMRHFEEHNIPYRCVRTEVVGCSSDLEYLVKLHCVRLSFQWLLSDPTNRVWLTDAGRQLLTDLLLFADKDPKDVVIAYEEMLDLVRDEHHWADIERELADRGVKALTFYDVVLDYILMDAFDDLDSPPASVTAVVNNRWLSHGFKESALATAVWSVLKAKRRLLTYPSGFMAHFYCISEQLSPVLAWGFLGPDLTLKQACLHFKEQVMGLLTDMFSFEKSRYTSVEELSQDIVTHSKKRLENISVKLASKSTCLTHATHQ